MAKRRQPLSPDAPLLHADHPRPVTRRDFLRQGFITGSAVTLGGSLFSLFADPRAAQAALSSDLVTLAATTNCQLGGLGAGRIPFICFDLAGGANLMGSNVLVGGQNGYLNSPISTSGYSKLGIPGTMIPGVNVDPTPRSIPGEAGANYINTTLGLPFHSKSAMLSGILDKVNLTSTAPFVNGAVIPARSDNDTANNPHNPMYGIAKTGSDGSIVTLVGSRNSESGGNSIAPAALVDSTIRPTKVDRPTDVTGLVDTGNLTAVLSDPADVKAVMESVVRLSEKKIINVDTKITADAVVKDLVQCGYLKAADIADRFAGVNIDPAADTDIVGPSGIFSQAEFDGDGEFRKAASVMKMVIDGYAGAGTIAMGGYDYHTGDRITGDLRDERAGRCIGACLEYAARKASQDVLAGRPPKPLMIYVFSDGSLASSGAIDSSLPAKFGSAKGVWTGDNSSTAGSFFLVFNPAGQPQAIRQQIGWFRTADASVDTASSPAANNVNLLVNTVILNYMALHGEQGNFATKFPSHGLGNSTMLDSLTAFPAII